MKKMAIVVALFILITGANAQHFNVKDVPGLVSADSTPSTEAVLLTDPFLQDPQANSVKVVWFTEFTGKQHFLVYCEGLSVVTGEAEQALASAVENGQIRVVSAKTMMLSRTREDQSSKVPGRAYESVTERQVWRHEALADGLNQGERLPYAVVSICDDGSYVVSDVYTLASKPAAGIPLKILLTSDHQSKPMTPANMQKVEETVGRVDAVFFAGDLVNVPDRASEWFDDERGGAFFPGLQGTAARELTYDGVTTSYKGGEIIQHAPLYAVIGNHEVMGRIKDAALGIQFNSPVPTEVAERAYEKVAALVNPIGDPRTRAQWIINNSFNANTYLEIFTLPESTIGSESYYAVTFGDVRLVALYITRIWRSADVSGNRNSKYVEANANLSDELEQGWGTFIFEPIAAGSPQYEWLREELFSHEFQSAKYKIVMFHHPVHNLGGNVVPSFTDPIRIEETDENGQVIDVHYEYSKADNYLIRDLEPLFEHVGVDLVFNGHNHVWNRFIGPTGVHYLETSNVGNSYGCYTSGRSARSGMPPEPWIQEDYDVYDDPYGLAPITPNIAPVLDGQGLPYPYVADNRISVFSIFDTQTGEITSYAYDTEVPDSSVWILDRFQLD